MVWSLSSVRVIGSWFREKRFKCSHSDPKMVDHIHAMLISCNGIKINMFSVLRARSFVNQLYPPISAKFSGEQSSPLGKWKTFGNYQSFNIPPSTLGTDSSVCASEESARKCCVQKLSPNDTIFGNRNGQFMEKLNQIKSTKSLSRLMHIECDKRPWKKKKKKNNFQIPNVNVLWRR